MAENERQCGAFLKGFLTGSVLGALAGIFLAPKSGKELRSDAWVDLSASSRVNDRGLAISDQIAHQLGSNLDMPETSIFCMTVLVHKSLNEAYNPIIGVVSVGVIKCKGDYIVFGK